MRGLVATLLVLAAAPAAQAAYAPKLAVKVDPAAPSAPAAVNLGVTQASGETANKTIVIRYPAGFTAVTPKVTPCPADQESAGNCTDASKIGTGSASTSIGALSGPIYLVSNNGALRLAIYLNGFGGLVTQKAYGDIAVAGGRMQITFTLPNTATTDLELAFGGGDKALATVTTTCGQAVFDGAFTSQNGEQTTAQAAVAVAGCATTPVISAVSVNPKAFRVVRKFSDTQRPGYGTTLAYTLSDATHGTRVTVQRKVKGQWRRAGSFIGTGDKGANQVRWDGRIRNKPLAAGSYRFSLLTTSDAGVRSSPVVVGFKIRG